MPVKGDFSHNSYKQIMLVSFGGENIKNPIKGLNIWLKKIEIKNMWDNLS